MVPVFEKIKMNETEIKVRPEFMKPLVTADATFTSVGDYQVTEQDLEKGRRDLGETENKKIEGLQKLKARFAKDTKVKYRTDDRYLLANLRYAKFDCDRAYKTIHKLYTQRFKNPEYFELTPKLEYLLKSGAICILPYKDEERRLLTWFNFRKWNLEDISFCELVQTFNVIADITCANPSLQLSGLVTIWDFRGLSLKHIALGLHPSTLRLLLSTTHDIYPYKPKLLIGLHTNSIIRSVFQLIRPLLKNKILDRVKFLGSDMSELHQYVNPAILPKEYGGMLEEDECITAQFILDNLPYIKYERSFGFLRDI